MDEDGRATGTLLVNDDGIDAPGLRLLEAAVGTDFGAVTVVAPTDERSGASHAISASHPVRLHRRDDRHVAVHGTPTDCVLLAWYELMARARPGLVLSGINRGANLAEDVIYSGTVAAAIEGALLGARSVALSQVVSLEAGARTQWETARRMLPEVLDFLVAQPWPEGVLYNVNFPDCPPEAVRGMRITAAGRRPPGAFQPLRAVDGRNVPLYWIRLSYPEGAVPPGSDLEAIADNAVSITPLQLDLTAHRHAARLADALGGHGG